jgi:N-acetylglucosamine kinase
MTICFDIGGSTIKGALAGAPEDIVAIGKRDTPTDDFGAFCRALAELAGATGEAATPLSIAIAGVVDSATGRIKCANIPCIDGRRLADDLAAALGRPVLVTNDADCFAVAEAGVGAGRGHRVVFGIILGTGVGGGVVVDGRLVEGAGGFAGEWGHGSIVARQAGKPPVDIPWFACGCGLGGCVDTVGGARGLERLHRYLAGTTMKSRAIMEAWRGGEPQAVRTFECYIELVAQPLAFAVNLLGADVVPVGGGMAHETAMLTRLDSAVRQRILRQTAAPLVVPGQCTGNPAFIGAALLAKERAP